MPAPKLTNYTLEDTKFFHIHLVLTNYCNNRCTYCGQYGDYGLDHFDVDKLRATIDFFHKALKGKKYRFFLEGGEPTKYKHLSELFAYLHELGEEAVLLSNGRIVDKDTMELVEKYYVNGTLWHIAAHVPVGQEPLSLVWNKDVYTFMDYMHKRGHKGSFVIVGIMHSVFDCRISLWFLLRWFSYFPGLIKSVELGFPHPNPMDKDFMDYKSRLDSMQYIMKFFDYCNKNNVDIGLGGFMLCLLEHGIEIFKGKYDYMKKIFLDVERKVDMDKSVEIHIDHNGKVTLLCSLSSNSYVTLENFFEYKEFSKFKADMNKAVADLYLEKMKRVPQKCGACQYNGNGCSGDHFNLVSTYETAHAA